MSITLINILVDAVVRKYLADIMDDMTIASTGLRGDNDGDLSLLLYVYASGTGSLASEWL